MTQRARSDVPGEQVLVFTLSGAMLAVPLVEVRCIAPMAALAEPPACSAIVHGVLDLGGIAVPVLRVSRLLDLVEFDPGASAHLIVLARRDPPLALAVSEVREIASMATGSLRSAGARAVNDCVLGAFDHGGATVHLLDVPRLLLRQEQQELIELQAMEQQRLRALVPVP